LDQKSDLLVGVGIMNADSKFTPSDKKTALRIFWGHIRRSNRDSQDTDKVKFLKKIPFFESLKKNQLELVSQVIYERNYSESEYIFEWGQPGAALFIIQSGEVIVEIPGKESSGSTQLAVLSKYSFFGELALLDEAPRSASARALVNTRVLALFRKDLDQLTETSPDITSRIYKALASIVGHRLKATNELIEKKLKAVA
jgi:CRP/FNR family transcriptional regulator, cyclic AMP receptor protein